MEEALLDGVRAKHVLLKSGSREEDITEARSRDQNWLKSQRPPHPPRAMTTCPMRGRLCASNVNRRTFKERLKPCTNQGRARDGAAMALNEGPSTCCTAVCSCSRRDLVDGRTVALRRALTPR